LKDPTYYYEIIVSLTCLWSAYIDWIWFFLISLEISFLTITTLNPHIDNLQGLHTECIFSIGSYIYNLKFNGVFGNEYANGKSS
jgi:hypothetical protein